MRRTAYGLLALVTFPFVAGCYGVTHASVPASHPERQALELRGIVVERPGNDESEVLEFSEIHQLSWTPSALSFVADVSRGPGRTETVTRLVPLTELEAVIVRQFDAGRTSAIMGGVIVGTIAVLAIILTGDSEIYEPG